MIVRAWDFTIEPYRGVGPIRLGMSKDEVRAVLGPPDKEFVRVPQFAPDHVEWIYDASRAFVGFDSRGRCWEIALTPPADPRLEGVRLLHLGASEAWAELRRLDPNAYVEDDALISKKFGVLICAPDVGTEFEKPGEPAQNILVFTPAYFEPLPAGRAAT